MVSYGLAKSDMSEIFLFLILCLVISDFEKCSV